MTQPPIDIDGALVARTLELEVERFRQLMRDGKITVLCERGTGDDIGRYRATFYFGQKRAQFLLASDGRLLGDT